MKWILRNEAFLTRAEAAVDVDDRGYQFGDGIYEVVRVYAGRPFLMHPHLVRLRRSAGELGIRLPWSDAHLEGAFEELIAREQLAEGILYAQVTRGVYPRFQAFPPGDVRPELTAYARGMPRPVSEIQNGIAAKIVPDIRWLRCDIKSINLLPNMLARQQAREHGCQEAIQHRNGLVTEGAFSNAYIVARGVVRTHPATNLILHGITRTHILDLCRDTGIRVREEPFTTEELMKAEEVFISNTASEVTPVVRLDGKPAGTGSPGPITRQLQTAFIQKLPSHHPA